jgi:hypothetical protein
VEAEAEVLVIEETGVQKQKQAQVRVVVEASYPFVTAALM